VLVLVAESSFFVNVVGLLLCTISINRGDRIQYLSPFINFSAEQIILLSAFDMLM